MPCAVTSKTKEISSPWKGGLLCLLRQIIYASHTMRPFESPKQDVLCFDVRENGWFSLFSSSRQHKILIEVRLPAPIFASLSVVKKCLFLFFLFLILSWLVRVLATTTWSVNQEHYAEVMKHCPILQRCLFLTLLYHVSPLVVLLFGEEGYFETPG